MALVVTIAQQKGGSGKTSLAAHLAVAWSNPPETDGRRVEPLEVIALDLDPQESLSRWFEVRQAQERETGVLDVRPAAGWRFASEITRARREAELVIIDLPPGQDRTAHSAIRGSDLVVVPLQLSPMDLWATAPTVELARSLGVEPILVMNRVPPRARLSDTIVQAVRAEEWPLATTMLGNRILFASSIMEGRGVTEMAPSSLAAAELRVLAREVMSKTRNMSQAA